MFRFLTFLISAGAIMATSNVFAESGIHLAEDGGGGGAVHFEKRADVPEKCRWNLAEIFKSDADFEAAFKKIEGLIESFKKFKGTLGKSGDSLLAGLKARDELASELDRVALTLMSS